MQKVKKTYSAEQINEILKKEKNVYFIGIGGISMSSLATICKARGLKVGGSDRCASETTDKLVQSGIQFQEGHEVQNIADYSVVVYNAAIHEDNTEYSYAASHNYFMIYRSDFLSYIISDFKKSVGVAGTHGKSTATAMIFSILEYAGLAPTVMNGAIMPEVGAQYKLGTGNCIVFEACEYKDSFLSFYPTVAVILNAEYDHADYFKDFDAYIASFRKYLSHAERPADCAVVNFDCNGARAAADSYKGTLYSYGIKNTEARIQAKNVNLEDGAPEFDICFDGDTYSHVKLSVFGIHNVYNTLAAACVAISFGLTDGDVFAKAAAKFRGIKRRFELKRSLNGANVYDDYAHHPTEITATLTAARKLCKGRLITVFQPHTYSRTKALFEDFANSLNACDQAIIADIYPARETDDLGMSAQLLANSIPVGKYVGNFQQISEYLKTVTRPDDLIVIMGAGDVNTIIEILD